MLEVTYTNLDVSFRTIQHGEVVLPGLDRDTIAKSRHVIAVLLEADLAGLLHGILVVVVLYHHVGFHEDQLVVLEN